ncbi:MAG: TonB-dependent receptor [Pseudomonadota bacterium]
MLRRMPTVVLRAAFAGLVTVSVSLAGQSARAASSEQEIFEFDIAAQPLADAIVIFSKTTRRQVSAKTEDIRGLRSTAIRGQLPPQEALLQMTTGLALKVTVVNGSSFTLLAEPTPPPSADRGRPLEELIVYGTKRSLSLQRTQTSVSVTTTREIEERALFTAEDILLRTANVSTNGDGTLNGLSIRGISLNGVGGTGRGQTANVYVDGSPNSAESNVGANNLWDFEQVEVLRGPQSTTQGRNALAGALLLTSADPDYEIFADVRAVIGNENNRQYSATVNIPLIDNQLALRLSADQREIDFEVLNVDTGNNTRFQDAFTGRAKLLWEPTDDLRLELGYSRTETDIGELNRIQPPLDTESPEFAAFDPFGRLTYTARERFDFLDVDRTYLEAQWDLSSAWSVFALVTLEDAERFNDFGRGFGPGESVTYSAELRVAFDSGPLNGWIGAYWFDLESRGRTTFIGPFPLPSIPADASVIGRASFGPNTTENRALFADITYDLNERWSFSAGLRYDEEDFSVVAGQSTFAISPPDCVVSGFVPVFGGRPCSDFVTGVVGEEELQPSGEFDAWLPRASILYRFDDERSLSLNYSRGYRAGGSFVRPFVPPELVQYDPEFLDNYELAWRSVWFNKRLSLNANLFYSDWRGQQVSIPGPLGFALDALIVNAGSSELYGLEIESQLKISDTLTGFASLGLVRTKFKDFPFAVDDNGNPVNPDDPTFADLAGNEFDNSPRTTFSLGLTWEHGAGWFASGNLSYASRQFSDVTNLSQNRAGGYTLVNARGGYRWQAWSISAFADNLFDERVIMSEFQAGVSTTSGSVEPFAPSFLVNDPTVYGVELRYTYR